jgi:hypothetical protein
MRPMNHLNIICSNQNAYYTVVNIIGIILIVKAAVMRFLKGFHSISGMGRFLIRIPTLAIRE